MSGYEAEDSRKRRPPVVLSYGSVPSGTPKPPSGPSDAHLLTSGPNTASSSMGDRVAESGSSGLASRGSRSDSWSMDYTMAVDESGTAGTEPLRYRPTVVQQHQQQFQSSSPAHIGAQLYAHPESARGPYEEGMAADRYQPYPQEMQPGHTYAPIYAAPPGPQQLQHQPQQLFFPAQPHHGQPGYGPQQYPIPQPPPTDPHQWYDTFRRVRRTQACDFCHTKRTRCVGDPCRNCVKRGIECVWRVTKKRGPKPKKYGQWVTIHETKSDVASIRKKASRADISNLLTVDDSSVDTGPDPNTLLQTPLLGADMSVSWADRFGPSSAMDDDSGTEYFQAPPIGDLMRRFYSDKVEPETREAILTFFDYSYSQIPIIHPSTFIRRVVAKKVDPLLIDAIKAVSARYITANTGRIVDATEYSSNVLSQILFNLEQPSLEVIQALLIVALHLSGNERANSYYVLIGTATCLLSRLGWNELDLYKSQQPSTWEEWVEHETKRRIFWNVYQQDNFTSLIFGRTNIIPESQIHVRSPCADSEWNDITFALYDSATGETPEPLNEDANTQQEKASSGVTASRSGEQAGSGGPSRNTWVWERKTADEPSQTGRRVVISGAISHTFMLLCELNTLDSRIIRFLNDAKPSRYGQKLAVASDRPFPAANFNGKYAAAQTPNMAPMQRSATHISEYPEFQKCTARLQSLFDSIKPPDHLSGSLTEPGNRKFFGGSDHGNFTARLRYLSIKSYICSRQIILHSSNRESFFEEFENPPDLHSVWPLQEREVRRIFRKVFGSTWSQGLLADDIATDSWKVCVDSAHNLAGFLRHNTDLPYTRYTFQLVLCVFLVTVIPLRQARRCKLALRAGDYSEMDPDRLGKELDIAVKDTQVLWETLQKASAMWKTDFMCGMLRALNIEEVTGNMGQFSSFAM